MAIRYLKTARRVSDAQDLLKHYLSHDLQMDEQGETYHLKNESKATCTTREFSTA